MIRILIFLLFILFFAGLVTWLGSLDSRIAGEAFGLHFDGPSGYIVGIVVSVFVATIYFTHKIKDILAIPAKIRARDAETKRARGIAALTRGLEAAAAGDGEDAAHHARLARRYLDDIALTRLLTAQAAQLSGDAAGARASFSAMLEAPETEFLGLRGLYAQALASGDVETAKSFAERAFRLRPNAQWAFQSVFDLGLDRGAWREIHDATAQAQKNRIIDPQRADRARAALLTACAYDAANAGDRAVALSEAEAALKLAPAFTPAAILAARLHAEASKTGKAAKVIETAFAGAAHPALIKHYDRLFRDESEDRRAAHLRKLAALNADAPEAALLDARAALLAGDAASAVETLEKLIGKSPSAAAYALMAKAAAALKGDEAARIWFEFAASAPRDPRPGADGEFHLTRDGWARLIREYSDYARLSPPPVEEAPSAAIGEEVRLLLAPPPAEKPAAPAASSLHDTEDPQGTLAAPEITGDHEHVHDDEEAERMAAAARNVS